MIRRLVFISFLFLSAKSDANVVSNGLQNFNTTYSGLDFITVHSSETLKPCLINLGFFANYAVNTLPYFEDGANQTRTNFNDTVLGVDLNLGYGLTDNWDIGLSLPHVVRQSVDNETIFHGEYAKPGNTEVRIATKYRLMGDDSHGLAAVFSVNFDRTINNPFSGSNPGPTYNLEFAADKTYGRWALGANIGYRRAQPGAPIAGSVIEPIGSQWIFSAAASRLMTSIDTKFIVEAFGAIPEKRVNTNNDRRATSLELLGGIKHDWNTRLALHFGGTTELWNGVSSPDWRLYAGLNYVFGPVCKKADYTRIVEDTRIRVAVRNINFDFDSDRMSTESVPIIEEIYDNQLKAYKSGKIIIVGHTDSIGSSTYNRELSLRRANTIRTYLIEKKGVPSDRVQALGKGEDEPIADNGNFQGRYLNRRVEFLLDK